MIYHLKIAPCYRNYHTALLLAPLSILLSALALISHMQFNNYLGSLTRIHMVTGMLQLELSDT